MRQVKPAKLMPFSTGGDIIMEHIVRKNNNREIILEQPDKQTTTFSIKNHFVKKTLFALLLILPLALILVCYYRLGYWICLAYDKGYISEETCCVWIERMPYWLLLKGMSDKYPIKIQNFELVSPLKPKPLQVFAERMVRDGLWRNYMDKTDSCSRWVKIHLINFAKFPSGIRFHFRPVQIYLPHVHQACFRAQTQNVDEQAFHRPRVALPEAADRAVIRLLVAGDHPVGHVFLTQLLDLPA